LRTLMVLVQLQCSALPSWTRGKFDLRPVMVLVRLQCSALPSWTRGKFDLRTVMVLARLQCSVLPSWTRGKMHVCSTPNNQSFLFQLPATYSYISTIIHIISYSAAPLRQKVSQRLRPLFILTPGLVFIPRSFVVMSPSKASTL
jgi:hypothetical protein